MWCGDLIPSVLPTPDVQGRAVEADDAADGAAVPRRRVRHLLQPQPAGMFVSLSRSTAHNTTSRAQHAQDALAALTRSTDKELLSKSTSTSASTRRCTDESSPAPLRAGVGPEVQRGGALRHAVRAVLPVVRHQRAARVHRLLLRLQEARAGGAPCSARVLDTAGFSTVGMLQHVHCTAEPAAACLGVRPLLPCVCTASTEAHNSAAD